MKVTQYLVRSVAIGLTCIFTLTHQCLASGFRIPEISITGLGTSNALVANTTEAGALAYNPSSMAFHDKRQLTAGLTNIHFELSATPTGGTHTDSTGDSSFLTPNFYYMARINSQWTWGLALNTPFGLETKWPKDTFPGFAGSLDGAEPALSKIEMFNLNPNVAYQIDANSSIAFGIDYYDVNKVNLNTQSTTISGSGQKYGWNIGFIQKAGDLQFGFSYHDSIRVPLEGMMGTTAITAELEFPSTMQFGVSYKATKRLLLEFDVDNTGWSSYDKILLRSKATNTTLVTSTNNWEDSTAYRLSGIYQLTEKTKLLFGYAKDDSPQTGLYRFSARLPDGNRQLYSLGIQHDIGQLTIEAAYMHLDIDTVTVNSSSAFGTYGLDANGTSLYNGTYKAKINLFGIGATYHF